MGGHTFTYYIPYITGNYILGGNKQSSIYTSKTFDRNPILFRKRLLTFELKSLNESNLKLGDMKSIVAFLLSSSNRD